MTPNDIRSPSCDLDHLLDRKPYGPVFLSGTFKCFILTLKRFGITELRSCILKVSFEMDFDVQTKLAQWYCLSSSVILPQWNKIISGHENGLEMMILMI